MRVGLSWLREFCPVDLSPEALGDLLAGKGMHVESIERPWDGLEAVVVARVLEVRDHPDSTTLCIARIDAGGAEREVVVGVRNMSAGDLVPYAAPGATGSRPCPNRSHRARSAVSCRRGCSAPPDELGVSADHTGHPHPAGGRLGPART